MRDPRDPVRDAAKPQQSADPRRWTALAAICTAQFMLMLDSTVINVALPAIRADLDLSRVEFTWAVSGYVLFLGGLLLLGGRLADTFGARTMLLTGLAVFTLASLTSGLAQDGTMLIVGRAFQGVGGALLSPAALRTLTGLFQGAERNKALGVWSSLGGVGFTVGLLAGGLLTSGPGWRWVFFINIPVGIGLLVAILVLVPERRVEGAARRVDVLGAVTSTAATSSLIYGVINAGNHGWADLGTLLAFVAAIVLYGVFTVVERTVRNPLMRLGVLAQRPVATGAFLMLTAAGVTGGDVFVTSQYLQHLHGYSALSAGLFFLPAAVASVVGAMAGGRLVGVVGTRVVACAGLALVAVGNALLIGLTPDGNVLLQAMPGVVLFALGATSVFVAATTSALAGVAQHEAGVVSGIVYTFNPTGAAIFVGVGSTVAAAGLAGTPSIGGFTNAYAVFAAVAVLAAATALVVAPSKKPQKPAAPNP
ncbi:MFS transporter [Actinosynnema sp. NPDC047251]|uniref:Permease, MFS-type n=1 Tax=Saccharothrix espanaensis (strain ATCC 51144 / DSM 44229 / JCM 9112 / NBRC 15066 / NRRL 15764) TaxID=1179773 RepID=K0K7X7_SACES|nr:MFS transporter [Saccharothrix espanaensis]CCH32763.1 Permease, MFS-type [Saccharothrix espanaensis DSM 44229]